MQGGKQRTWKRKSAWRHYAVAVLSCAYCTVHVRQPTDSECATSSKVSNGTCMTLATTQCPGRATTYNERRRLTLIPRFPVVGRGRIAPPSGKRTTCAGFAVTSRPPGGRSRASMSSISGVAATTAGAPDVARWARYA